MYKISQEGVAGAMPKLPRVVAEDYKAEKWSLVRVKLYGGRGHATTNFPFSI